MVAVQNLKIVVVIRIAVIDPKAKIAVVILAVVLAKLAVVVILAVD